MRCSIRRAKFWNILRIKDFSIFVFSQTISQFGDKLDYIALIALIGLLPKSRTPFLLSQLAIFITLPVLIFGPIAGVLVDRWQRKKVMVVCDALRMLCALAIPLVFIATKNIYPVFAVVFFMFLLALFFNTARSAIIPNLVSKKRILTANSVINFVGRGATFLGMFLGGIIIDWKIWQNIFRIQGWTAAFIVDAVTFGVSAVMLYVMHVQLLERTVEERPLQPKGFFLLIRDGLVKMWCELRHAVNMIIKEKNLAFAMATIFLMIIVGSVIYVLVIPIVQQEMGWGASGVGILASVGALGLLLGAYLTGVFGHHLDLKILVTVCFIFVGGALVVFPFANHFWMFALISLICGTIISPVFITQDTLIHNYADELVRGRVFSLRDWVLNCSFVVAALIVGSLSTFTKKVHLFVIFGIITIICALIGWIILARDKSR